ncbi:hypothetical protein BC834DRAFT_167951 [Gloeopeniophorella convolvens]|nr:hypothetical protein BC834DRAFT_167951 [Gloeopeniophorella convolvens]
MCCVCHRANGTDKGSTRAGSPLLSLGASVPPTVPFHGTEIAQGAATRTSGTLSHRHTSPEAPDRPTGSRSQQQPATLAQKHIYTHPPDPKKHNKGRKARQRERGPGTTIGSNRIGKEQERAFIRTRHIRRGGFVWQGGARQGSLQYQRQGICMYGWMYVYVCLWCDSREKRRRGTRDYIGERA